MTKNKQNKLTKEQKEWLDYLHKTYPNLTEAQRLKLLFVSNKKNGEKCI